MMQGYYDKQDNPTVIFDVFYRFYILFRWSCSQSFSFVFSRFNILHNVTPVPLGILAIILHANARAFSLYSDFFYKNHPCFLWQILNLN